MNLELDMHFPVLDIAPLKSNHQTCSYMHKSNKNSKMLRQSTFKTEEKTHLFFKKSTHTKLNLQKVTLGPMINDEHMICFVCFLISIYLFFYI